MVAARNTRTDFGASDGRTSRGRKLRELRALAAIGEAAAKSGGIDQTYERIARVVGSVLHFDRLSIASCSDQEAFTDVFVLDRRIPQWRKGETYRLRGPLASEVIEDGRFDQLIEQIARSNTRRTGLSFPDRFPSMLRVPIEFRDQVIGSLALRSERPRVYSRRHLAFARQVAARLAPTVEYLRLLSQCAAKDERAAAARRWQPVAVQNMSERLQNPLTALRTAAGLIADSANEKLEHRQRMKAVALLERSMERLGHVIDRTMEYVSIEARDRQITFETFNAADLLRKLFASKQAVGGARNIAVLLPGSNEQVLGYGDPRLLGRCFEEIIDNAHRYTPARGRIEAAWRLEDMWLILEVTNTGDPIATEPTQGSPFPYYVGRAGTTDGEVRSGLGLCIAAAIAKAHGGILSIDSSAGVNRVRIRLPSLNVFGGTAGPYFVNPHEQRVVGSRAKQESRRAAPKSLAAPADPQSFGGGRPRD